jgi:hypothetical protein
MRRFVICVAAVLGLALFTTTPAYASHANVQGEIDVFHGTKNVGSFFNRAACTTESCPVTVTVSRKRDYNRFVRWCGSTTDTVTIPSGESFSRETCFGPSTWRILVRADLLDANFDFDATHPSAVDVTITVTT